MRRRKLTEEAFKARRETVEMDCSGGCGRVVKVPGDVKSVTCPSCLYTQIGRHNRNQKQETKKQEVPGGSRSNSQVATGVAPVG